MNQHGSCLCEELLPHPVSKLEAAPAALRLPEGMLQGNKDLLPENEREKGLKQRRQGKLPSTNSSEVHGQCFGKETACGAGSSG